MKTLKLYTSDGKAVTDLQSADDTISLPTEIRWHTEATGVAVAGHADGGDLAYSSLEALCSDCRLDVDTVRAQDWQ
jgi:hypothetical protein